MEVIEYFGPRVAKSKLSNLDTLALFEICKQASTPRNSSLVGLIKEEMDISDALSNSNVGKILLQYANDYLTSVDSGYWKKVLDNNSIGNLLEITEAWYNKQVAMEFNPVHNHRMSADLVCVVFPKIALDKTVDSYYINNAGDKQTGQLNFINGECSKNDFGRTRITVQPEEGDVFVFPSTLDHYTTPVLGNSIRYSISCNLKFTNLAHRLLNTLNKHEN
jgi:hypothetical protein